MSLAPRTREEDELRIASPAARGSNQSGMRAYNERLVLSLVRQAGPMPKAAIARMTGLSAQTVSVIMRALETDGLLQKGEPVRGKVGQPSVPMGLAPNGAFFLGLRIGRRSAELLLSDFLGRVKRRTRQSHRHPTFDGAMPTDARAELVKRATLQLRGIRVPGLEVPEIRQGTIGTAARSLGAASLPLADRFLVDQKAFLKG